MGDEAKSNSNSSEQDSAALGLAADFLVGGGRFSLTRELGRGGMSVVWLARDERLDEAVALKFLPTEVRADAMALSDMRRETQKSRRLAHPNIVRIYDLYEAPGEPAFISMEFIDGPNLHDLRANQPNNVFSWEFLKPLIKQLCDALDYAHSEQIIHRDLKPANLMLDSKGRLKLADFGIAAVAAESTTRMTGRFACTGTVTHMSPQQLDGGACGVSDDIYALGVTLYELLASRPPFYSGDIAHQVRNFSPPPIDERLAELKIQNDIPRDVAAMIMACLSKSLESRPPSARAVAEWIGLAQTTSPPTHITPPVSAPEQEPAQTLDEPVDGRARHSVRAGEILEPEAARAERRALPVTEAEEFSSPSPKKSLWTLVMIAAFLVLVAVGWFGRNYFFSHAPESRDSATTQTPNDPNSFAPASTAPAEETTSTQTPNAVALTFNETGPGSLDTDFDPGKGPNSEIRALALQEDGSLLVGGSFKTFNDEDTGGLVRLRPDGLLDHRKIPQVRGNVHAITVLADKKILVGGSFDSVGGVARRGMARFNSDLTLDTSFDPGDGPNNREIWCMAVANGKIYVGGNFASIAGFKSQRIARLNMDGRVDRSFDAGEGANKIVWQILTLPSGAVLIGGNFDSVQNQHSARLARLLPNGKRDPNFPAGVDDNVHALAFQPDGKILIAGEFSRVQKKARSRMARLNADGSLDSSFNSPSINNKGIRAIALQPDAKIVIGGVFSEINSVPRQALARLNADGSLDESFVAGISSVVRKILIQRDEKILVAGAFAGANNLPRRSIARFNSSGAVTKAAANQTGGDWKILFDGTSTASWRGYNQDAFPSGAWKLEDGALKTIADISPAQRCDLITKAQFKNFELQLEWRAADDANSGIFYRAVETADRVSLHAPEMQIAGEGTADSQKPISATGALYGLLAAEGTNLKPAGEFNEARIAVRGNHVEHWLNGTKVLDYTWGSPEMNRVVAANKFKVTHEMQAEGHIALQQNGGEVWFRNIRIRSLPDEEKISSAAPAIAVSTAARPQNFSTAQSVSIDLGKMNRERGLQLVEYRGDGQTTATNISGRDGRLLARQGDHQAYCYLKADASFKREEQMNLRVVMDFFDAAPGILDVEYDTPRRHNARYTPAGKKDLTGNRTWRTEEFHLKQARLRNAQNGGADFRIRCNAREVFVQRVTVFRE